jgi:hypothetical protein
VTLGSQLIENNSYLLNENPFFNSKNLLKCEIERNVPFVKNGGFKKIQLKSRIREQLLGVAHLRCVSTKWKGLRGNTCTSLMCIRCATASRKHLHIKDVHKMCNRFAERDRRGSCFLHMDLITTPTSYAYVCKMCSPKGIYRHFRFALTPASTCTS